MKITPARFRLAVQAGFALFCLYVGYRFVLFLDWVSGRTELFTPKPGAVEGFLPISALLGLRKFLATGLWDRAHPAGLTIFLAILAMAFLLRKGFCGYVCPVGLLSGLLERAGRRLGLAKVPPRFIDLPLRSLKFLFLGAFLFPVLTMDGRSLDAFLRSPFNVTSDARMLDFFLSPSATALLVIGVLIALSLVIRNFWCRCLCPYGALLGLAAWVGPVHVTRDADTCVGCGKCTARCPAAIEVEKKETVTSPECMGCAECIGACPVRGCLAFTVLGRKRIPWASVGAGVILVLLIARIWAGYAGNWDSAMPQEMLRRFYALGAM
ncbi:MAG: 4Fe-4S binding protein [Pseudodesulfovibrio sp.]|uniref:4Fe-4S binding protein n=1 Tax=Pseudodesulfovibrio sp. TaxID=2035812 RepID=UPI003D0DB2D3